MIAIIGDVHFHNWSDFAEPSTTYEGLNTRAEAQIDAMLEAFADIANRGIKTVVFAGDLFHKKNFIYIPLYNVVKETLQLAVNEYELDIYIIAGNHDVVNRAGDNSAIDHLEFNGTCGRIICATGTHPFNIGETEDSFNINLYCYPWGTEIEPPADEHKNDINVMVTHAMVKGAVLFTGHPVNDGLQRSAFNNFDFSIVGHIHEAQVMQGGKVLIPGSMTHLNRGEVGVKGYWLLNLDKGNGVKHGFTQVPIETPSFSTMTLEQALDDEHTIPDDINYITVEVPKNTKSGHIEFIKNKFKHLEIRLKPERVVERVRSTIKLTDDTFTLMEKYAREKGVKDREKLLEYGKGLINE